MEMCGRGAIAAEAEGSPTDVAGSAGVAADSIFTAGSGEERALSLAAAFALGSSEE